MDIKTLYKIQTKFQEQVIKNIGYNNFDEYKQGAKANLPVDDPRISSYHIQGLMSEIGEILNADKRWKNYRIDNIDMNNKLEEIVDCLIFILNIAIFSGFSAENFNSMISKKIKENLTRIGKEEILDE